MNEPIGNRSSEEERLDGLFRAYRLACEPREISSNFMPELWQKIERVQSGRFSFRRIAQGFVTASAALSLVLASFVFLDSNPISPLYNASYEETLAAGHNDSASDSVDVIDVSHPDSPDDLEEL